MNRNIFNYLIDIGLAVTFILSFFTGLIKFLQIYRIIGINSPLLRSYQMSVIHDWSGIFMILFVLVHLIVHWRWIVCTTKNLFKEDVKCQK